MKYISFLFFILLSFTSQAQYSTRLMKGVGSTPDIAADTDIYTVSEGPYKRMYIAAYNDTCKNLWAKSIDSIATNFSEYIAVSANRILVTSSIDLPSPPSNQRRPVFILLDKSGNVIAQKRLSFNGRPSNIIALANDTFLIAITGSEGINTPSGVAMVKCDAQGNVVNEVFMQGVSGTKHRNFANETVLVSGVSNGFCTITSLIDYSQVRFSKRYNFFARDICKVGNGYMLVGVTDTSGCILRLDSLGNLLWAKRTPYTKNIEFKQIENDNGRLVILGQWDNLGYNRNDPFIAEIDTNGNILRSFRIGYERSEEAIKMVKVNNEWNVLATVVGAGYQITKLAPNYLPLHGCYWLDTLTTEPASFNTMVNSTATSFTIFSSTDSLLNLNMASLNWNDGIDLCPHNLFTKHYRVEYEGTSYLDAILQLRNTDYMHFDRRGIMVVDRWGILKSSWSATEDGFTPRVTICNAVQLPSGDVIAVGNGYVNPSESSMICKLDSTGRTIWRRMFRNTESDRFIDIKLMPDSTLIVAGTSSQVMKLDLHGSIIWSYSYHTRENPLVNDVPDYITALSTDCRGNIYFTIRSGDIFTTQTILVKLDKNGNRVYAHYWRDPLYGLGGQIDRHFTGKKILVMPDESVVVVCEYFYNVNISGAIKSKTFFMYVDADGNYTHNKSFNAGTVIESQLSDAIVIGDSVYIYYDFFREHAYGTETMLSVADIHGNPARISSLTTANQIEVSKRIILSHDSLLILTSDVGDSNVIRKTTSILNNVPHVPMVIDTFHDFIFDSLWVTVRKPYIPTIYDDVVDNNKYRIDQVVNGYDVKQYPPTHGSCANYVINESLNYCPGDSIVLHPPLGYSWSTSLCVGLLPYSITVTPPAGTDYILFDSSYCIASLQYAFIVDTTLCPLTPVGIIDEPNFTVNVYPNPASTQLFLDADVPIKGIKVLNAVGEEVATIAGQANYIDVRSLPNGTYILHVEGVNNKVVYKRWFKM